jgi:ATP-dependent RNA helicase RhlE
LKFKNLNISDNIIQALHEEGYTEPTPIQTQCIPLVLNGHDVLGCAQTGTGKTAAFAIPMIQNLQKPKTPKQEKARIRSLILTPTRELAIQIGESFATYGKHSNISHLVIFGGVGQKPQTDALRTNKDVLIATPGRLLDLIQQKFITLKDIEIFVLDEADRMLDMGFIHDIKQVLKHLPEERQSLFFSATMPNEILKLSHTILNKPKEVKVTPVSSTAEIVDQYIYFVDKVNKPSLLLQVLQKLGQPSTLVFTRTKHGADRLVKFLAKSNIKAQAIHGDKAQSTRQNALNSFKSGDLKVLIATDIAARGIDIDELKYVVNYEIPNIAETYVHRIGRTGRAGNHGTAISFCDAEEKAYLKDIEKLINKKLKVEDNPDYPLVDHNPIKPERPPRPPKKEKQSKQMDGRDKKQSPKPDQSPQQRNKPPQKFTGWPDAKDNKGKGINRSEQPKKTAESDQNNTSNQSKPADNKDAFKKLLAETSPRYGDSPDRKPKKRWTPRG